MTYNLSNLTNNFDIVYFADFVNRESHGVMALTILISLFLLVFIGTKNFESKRSFAAASFATSIVAVLFSTIGWIDVYITIGFVILGGVAAFLLLAENG